MAQPLFPTPALLGEARWRHHPSCYAALPTSEPLGVRHTLPAASTASSAALVPPALPTLVSMTAVPVSRVPWVSLARPLVEPEVPDFGSVATAAQPASVGTEPRFSNDDSRGTVARPPALFAGGDSGEPTKRRRLSEKKLLKSKIYHERKAKEEAQAAHTAASRSVRPPCVFHAKGRCGKGAACTFAHDAVVDDSMKELCRNFVYQRCSKGVVFGDDMHTVPVGIAFYFLQAIAALTHTTNLV